MRRAIIPVLLVCAAAAAQDDFDRVLQLARTRQKMAQALTHLPDYTCVATAQRSVQKAGRADFKVVDTLRYEIAHAGGTELWSWPGASKFEDKPVIAMIRSGSISQGEFSSHARGVFIGGYANVKFAGAEDLAGRHTLRWEYNMPMFASGWTITANDLSAPAASRGSFWADADTLDVVRLEVRSEGLPMDFPISSAVNIIDYARVRIGSSSILLPQTASLHLEHSSGERRRNLTEFSHCRQYAGTSAISFETAPASTREEPSEAAKMTEISLPAGLRVPIKLKTQIDSAKAVVGDLVEGIVDGDLSDHQAFLVPKGSLITGRLRRMEKYSDPSTHFLVGIEFDDIDFPGHHARFFGSFKSLESEVSGFSWFLSSSSASLTKTPLVAGDISYSSTRETEHLPDVPGVGMFFMQGSGFRLPQGMRMVWQTQ
jgi:hypothetical protein